MAYHGTRPGRFEYVHPPNHGSWLNMIECAFSKMARTFLRPIRVISVDEIKARILKGIDEFNYSPRNGAWGFDSLSRVRERAGVRVSAMSFSHASPRALSSLPHGHGCL